MTSARKTKHGKEISFCTSLGAVQPLTEKQVGTGAEIHSAIASGIVTGVAPVSYRPFFFLVSSNSSRDLCESNLSQFPFRFTILHTTEHQIKKEHSFISKLLKTRQYSLMNSRVPFSKDRVSAIPGRQLSLRSFRLFSGSFSVDKTVLRSKARKRFIIAEATCSQKDGFALNLALSELIILQGTGPRGFQALTRLPLF